MSSLVACPSCACHVTRTESVCPHCGLDISKTEGGSVVRTASAVVLGLAVAAAAGSQLAACGDDVQSDYGAGASVPEGGGGASGTAGGGGEGGAQGDDGAASSE